MIAYRAFSQLVVLLLIMSMSVSVAQAQEAASDTEPELEPRGSNRGMIFTLDALSLAGVDAGVGMKQWISPTTALRLSLNMGIESTEDVVGNDVNRGLSAIDAGVGFVVEWHRAERGRVSPYMGSGFLFGAGAFSETTDFQPGSPLRQVRVKGSTLDFGVSVVLGVEYRLARRVSLAGEHQIDAIVQLSDQERRERPEEGATVVINQDARSFTFGTGTSRLIVAVYF